MIQDTENLTSLTLPVLSVICTLKMVTFGATSVMVAELKNLAATNANQAVGIVSIKKKKEF